MKAVRVHAPGGVEVLKIEEIELGKPDPSQALIQIHTAGLNFVDIYFRRGTYPIEKPYTPGWEASGTVVEIGSLVTNVKVGDRVAYVHEPGSYAEMSLVDAQNLILIPKELSFEQGAAFPLQGMTAHYLIHEFYTIKPNDTVLIHAAAGGMGQLLVQWARHLGARVIGTVSTEEKAKSALAAGAQDVILYTQKDFASETLRLTKDEGADFIIDGVGKSTFTKNLEAVKRRGHVVIFGSASGPADPIVPNSLMSKSITISGGSLMNYILTPEELNMRSQAVIEGVQKGWLKLKMDHILPLDKVQEAHRLLESRQTMGKVLLKVRS